MKKIRLATIWLDGCSGCHMSFLDMDEKLLEVAPFFDVVYSPYVDEKEYPKDVDLAIVEGAISSEHDLEIIKQIRANTKTIIALGDCAITGNVSAMKNLFGSEAVLEKGYFDLSENKKYPSNIVPKLLDKVLPLHEIVKIDYFLRGCPTNSNEIFEIIKKEIEKNG